MDKGSIVNIVLGTLIVLLVFGGFALDGDGYHYVRLEVEAVGLALLGFLVLRLL